MRFLIATHVTKNRKSHAFHIKQHSFLIHKLQLIGHMDKRIARLSTLLLLCFGYVIAETLSYCGMMAISNELGANLDNIAHLTL